MTPAMEKERNTLFAISIQIDIEKRVNRQMWDKCKSIRLDEFERNRFFAIIYGNVKLQFISPLSSQFLNIYFALLAVCNIDCGNQSLKKGRSIAISYFSY